MSTNKVSSGRNITQVAPSGGVTSGVPILIGTALFGVPTTTAAAGASFNLERGIEITYTAEGAGSGQAWAVGDQIYWDNTNKRFTKTSSGNTLVGTATAAKLTAATSGQLVLTA